MTSHKLGVWLHSDFTHWIWFFHPSSLSLFQQYGLVWKVWRRKTNRDRLGTSSKFKYFTQATRVPNTCRRATVTYWSSTRVKYTGSIIHYLDNRTSFSNHIPPSHLPLELKGDDIDSPNLIEALRQGTVHIVCDGSFLKDFKLGSAGWVIESHDGQSQSTGAMGVSGSAEVQSACRSELSEIVYTLLHLQQLCNIGNISGSLVKLHCDGLSAIQAITKYTFGNVNNDTKTNFDLLNVISSLCQQLPITIQLEHVKGHQDKGSAYNILSRVAQLNILADQLASEKQHQ